MIFSRMKFDGIYAIMVLITMALFSCNTTKTTGQPAAEPQTEEQSGEQHKFNPLVIGSEVVSPVVYVYKTKNDYSNLVPVIMDESRTRIVSYPAPSDVKTGGKLALPTRLKDGYLLDNRGIGPNVAFLSYTYEEYSKMKSAPSMDVLMENIIDKYPLTELRSCGHRSDYRNIEEELNEIIGKGELDKVSKRIK